MASGAGGSGADGGNSRALLLLLLTSGFFVTGLLFDYMPTIIDDQIKRIVELATNEEIRSIWSRPPVEFESYYWLYDVQNPDQFLTGEKVRVRKVGPFHFSSRQEKRIIEVSANKYRISYNSTRIFALNESSLNSANWRLDQPLVLLNPVYASVAEGTREVIPHLDPELKGSAYAGMNRLAEKFNETLFRNTTAREALLGRRVVMIEKAKKMAETFGMTIKIPDVLPGGVFGFIAAQNSTLTGPFEIYTGFQATMSSLGDVISFKGKRRMTEYKGKCNRLQASAGELRPMPIGLQENLEMFSPQFCRIIHLKPTGLRNLREGLAVSYVIAPEDFSSAQMNADNQCFCVNGTRDDYCSLDGAIELAPCSYFSPLVATMPHVAPDARILNSIDEFDVDLLDSNIESKAPVNHTSQLLILRRLGFPVQADITVTLFMKVIRDPMFRQTGSVPEISYIPLMMAREFAVIPPKLGQIVVNLESFLALTYHIKVVMYLSGVVLLCWLTGHYYSRGSSSRRRSDRVVPHDSGDSGSADGHAPADGGGGGGGDDAPNNRNGSRDDGRQLEGEMKTNGQVNGTGTRKRAAAQPIDSLSERANSADSSKSQPPSRASRSSLGDGSSSSTGGPEVAASATKSTLASGGGAPRDAAKSLDDNGLMAAQGQRAAQRKSKIFSKLDDELLMRDKRNQVTGGSGQNEAAAANGSSAGETQNPGQGGETNGNDNGAQGNETGNGNGTTFQLPAKRRNWFVKVCSNFIRMLGDLRSSISDVGQLDVAENSDDYQDKQLAMLAGKIDNWYNNSESASATEAEAESSRGAANANTMMTDKTNRSSEGQEVAAKRASGGGGVGEQTRRYSQVSPAGLVIDERSSGGGGLNGGGLAPSGSGETENKQKRAVGKPQADGSATLADISQPARGNLASRESIRRPRLGDGGGSRNAADAASGGGGGGSSWLAEPETSVESVISAPSLVARNAKSKQTASGRQSEEMGSTEVAKVGLSAGNQSAAGEMATTESTNNDNKSTGNNNNNYHNVNKAEIDELSSSSSSTGSSNTAKQSAAAGQLHESPSGKTEAPRPQQQAAAEANMMAKDERPDSGVKLGLQSRANQSNVLGSDAAGHSSGSMSKLDADGHQQRPAANESIGAKANGGDAEIGAKLRESQSSGNNNNNNDKSNISTSDGDNIGQLGAVNGRRQAQQQPTARQVSSKLAPLNGNKLEGAPYDPMVAAAAAAATSNENNLLRKFNVAIPS